MKISCRRIIVVYPGRQCVKINSYKLCKARNVNYKLTGNKQKSEIISRKYFRRETKKNCSVETD